MTDLNSKKSEELVDSDAMDTKNLVNKQNDRSASEEQEPQKLPLLHILTSVFAAAIGVQSKKNQEKDFNGKGSIYIYIAAGVIFTMLFVITVATVVKTVLANAGM